MTDEKGLVQIASGKANLYLKGNNCMIVQNYMKKRNKQLWSIL